MRSPVGLNGPRAVSWGIVNAALLALAACGGGGTTTASRGEAAPTTPVPAGPGVLSRERAGADLLPANLAYIGWFPTAATRSWTAGLGEIGLTWMSIDVHRDMLEGVRAAKLDAAVAEARRLGAKLVLALELAKPNEGPPPSGIDAWLEENAEACGRFAARYRPEFLSIVDEFGTREMWIGGITLTTAEWIGYVTEASRRVKAVSPGTLTGVSSYASEREIGLLQECMRIPTIDSIGGHFYGGGYDVFERVVFPQARAAGKQIHIDEAWREGLCYQWSNGCFLEDKEGLDVEWMATIASYAERNQVLFVVPFWTNAFFHYGRAGQLWEEYGQAYWGEELPAAVLASKRTQVHAAYRALLTTR